jgi:hypothetical protein
VTKPSDDYAQYADHPLHGVPDAVLIAAREQMTVTALWEKLDAEHANAMADAMVLAVLPPMREWLTTVVKLDRPRSSRILMACGYVALGGGFLLWALGNTWICAVAGLVLFLALGGLDAALNPIKLKR